MSLRSLPKLTVLVFTKIRAARNVSKDGRGNIRASGLSVPFCYRKWLLLVPGQFACKSPYRIHDRAVLLLEHARRERRGCIAGFDRHAALDDDLTEIDGLRVDSMHGTPGLRRARREHGLVDLVAVHTPAPEEREERGMEVDHRHAGKSHKEDRREDVVEPRENDELGADTCDGGSRRGMRRRPVRVRAKREDRARYAGERSPLQRGNAGMIRDDDRDARIEL